ncbi:MAG: flagellar basal body-associated FliL family protein [bacterium]
MVDRREKETEIDSADDLFLEEIEEEPAPSTALDEDEVTVEVAPREVEEEEEEEPSHLVYYGVPAVGALLILSLGWTFAFIVRQGLTPPAKPKVASSKIFERSPAVNVFGRMGKSATGDVTVPISYPFFIPLEGGSVGAKDGKKTKPTVFLNLSVNVLVSNRAAATEFNAKRTLIREEIFSHYNRLAPKDLETAESRERIRRQLIAKIGKKIVQGEVKGILFQEFFTR